MDITDITASAPNKKTARYIPSPELRGLPGVLGTTGVS